VTRRRSDIQGLRAFAVLAVLAFHAGLPVPGGFVGVDVFFVISGFVICQLILRRLEEGSFSLRDFYLRRFRRLTPALMTVILFTVIGSALILPPLGGGERSPQESTALTAVGAVFLMANVVVHTLSGDYFGQGQPNPLLHTWSLSVEEQFYLVFPALLLAVAALARGRARNMRVAAFVAVSLLSLASLAMIRGVALGIPVSSWALSYYSTLTRAWEFGVGAAVAVLAPKLTSIPLVVRYVGAGLGLAGLLGSLWLIDASTPFPGKATLLPCVGAALVIGLGEGTAVGRMLSFPWFTRIGDLSYSLYLWHWPLVVFSKVLFLGAWVPLLATLLSIAPAVISYRLVEERYRSPRLGNRLAARRIASMVAAAALVSLVAWRPVAPAMADAFRTGELDSALERGDVTMGPGEGIPGERCSYPDLIAYIGENGACQQSNPGAKHAVAVIGDSHAEHLYAGLVHEWPDVNVVLIAFRAPMAFGGWAPWNKVLDQVSADPQIDAVVFSRHWANVDDWESTQLQPFSHAVSRLAGGPALFVTDDVPAFPFESVQCAYRLVPVVNVSRCDLPDDDAWVQRDRVVQGLRSAIDGRDVTLVPTFGAFCDQASCSMVDGSGRLLYSDWNHLTVDGSAIAARVIASSVGDPAGLSR